LLRRLAILAVTEQNEGDEYMGYIDQNLAKGERVVYRTRQHKIIFALPTLFMVIALQGRFLPGRDCCDALVAVGALWWMATLLSYFCTEFGVTTRRVIIKAGIFRLNSIEVLNSQVESIKVKQSVLGRVLDYGTVTVTGGGGTDDVFYLVDRPGGLLRAVRQWASQKGRRHPGRS
jgi:uncharacterized membrane protein YdbT with pleckstrin-like domain